MLFSTLDQSILYNMIPKINFKINHYEQNIEQFWSKNWSYVIDILLDTIEIISKQNKNNNIL